MHDVQDMRREIEREREEMTRDVRREKRKEDGGQRKEKGKKKIICTLLIVSFWQLNYQLRRFGLVLIFPLLGSLTLFYTRGGPWASEHTEIL